MFALAHLRIIFVGAAVLLAAPDRALAGEEHLEFKFVVHPLDRKVFDAPGIQGQVLGASLFFGVAYFSDGRIATKDFISSFDTRNGKGTVTGYSTYTFEDGSSITATFKATAGDASGDYTIVSGTGKYANATGTGHYDPMPAKFTDGAFAYTGKFDVKTP